MEEKDIKEIAEDISVLIESHDRAMVQNIIVDLHPADIAEIVHHLNDDDRNYIINLLDAETASNVLLELDNVSREDVLEDLDHKRISEMVDEMDSDDAADIVSELPTPIAEKVLQQIDKQDSDEVKELLRHDEETAGGIMAKEFVAVHRDSSVDEAIQEIRNKADEVDLLYYVYVVDDHDKLVGTAALKDLILAKGDVKVSQIMDTDVISVDTKLDQEEVAKIARKYDLVSVPVVNKEEKIVGRITFDDLADVMEEETSEDIQRMAGISDDEQFRETSPFRIMKVRLPWLLVGFCGELISAAILKHFEVSLDQIIAAAFFIPIIMAMGGNAGIQSSTIMVRGIATGEISIYHAKRRLLREITVSLLNGLILAVLILGVISLWFDKVKFGIVLATAMLFVIINASIVGAIMPVILKKLGVDPAIATGPFITTSNDVLGLLIYLALITLFLPWM